MMIAYNIHTACICWTRSTSIQACVMLCAHNKWSKTAINEKKQREKEYPIMKHELCMILWSTSQYECETHWQHFRLNGNCSAYLYLSLALCICAAVIAMSLSHHCLIVFCLSNPLIHANSISLDVLLAPAFAMCKLMYAVRCTYVT